MDKYICYFDGACEPKNPGGNMGLGCLVIHKEQIIYSHSEYISSQKMNGKTSNNVAEYMSLINLLSYLYRTNLTKQAIEVFGDSMLVINQMNKEWRIKEGAYVPYANRAKKALGFFEDISFMWIPREKNELADNLSKRKMIENNCEFKIQPL